MKYIARSMTFARTIRHLRPAQLMHRARLRAQRRVLRLIPATSERLLRAPAGRYVGWPETFTPIDALLQDWRQPPFPRFRFNEIERDLGVENDWDQQQADQLWRYQLHYFEWAFGYSDPEAFVPVWQSWRSRSTFGRGDAWSPYVTSLRAWTFCAQFRQLVSTTPIEASFVEDLLLHARFLRTQLELDVGGNHLIKNLKALVGLAVFFANEHLMSIATRHLSRQVEIQILPDGGHYERSPSYHCQVLGDLLDIEHLLAAAHLPPVPGVADAIHRMRVWLGAMLMPDGDVPLFNDCVLVGHDRLRLLAPINPDTSPLTVLEPSGYVIMRPSPQLHLVVDVGLPCPDELPAHAHADCLSFELSFNGQRVVVDSGTSTYQGSRRAHERSTGAHNTVEVDDCNQTEVWGTFRAGRRARPRLERTEVTDGTVVLVASHSGYEHLPGRPRHCRRITATADQVQIEDTVSGAGRHRVAARLYATSESLRVTASSPIVKSETVVATGFGRLRDATLFATSVEGTLPLLLTTTINP